MNWEEYISKKKEIKDIVINLIKNDEDEDKYITEFTNLFESSYMMGNTEEKNLLCTFLSEASNNYKRGPNFFTKIEKILKILINNMGFYDKEELLNTFKNNKMMLLLLIKNNIIEVDKYFADFIVEVNCESSFKYKEFFFNEVSPFMKAKIRKNFLESNKNLSENYEENRKIGENETYICKLIREDSLDDFIIYVNKFNIGLNTIIEPSVFETNLMLIEKKPSLIEYAAFFGSIQIFNYLRLNNVPLTKFLWFYAIHSGNPELIYLLERQNISDISYEKCFIESIKCYNDEFAEYIKNQYLPSELTDTFSNDVYEAMFKSYNFSQFDDEIINGNFNNSILKNLIRFNYDTCANLYLDSFDKIDESIEKYKFTLSKDIIDINTVKYSIVKVIIPSSCLRIDDRAFLYFTNLIEITIPSSVVIIGKEAFLFCDSLSKITFNVPSSLERIEQDAFNSCRSLEKIDIPFSVKTIKSKVFFNCTSLVEIKIPPWFTNMYVSNYTNIVKKRRW
ncbi:hypothetical protein M9Y10_006171 [Tritrichomonas musculus]|uniref:Uncharacterized protein n=1 Tax=Tritrichomonas musculus TaxID=1915356 RepID=A0ABR2JEM0_9EUKA